MCLESRRHPLPPPPADRYDTPSPLPPTGTTLPSPSRRQVRHSPPPPADRYDTPLPPPADRYDTPSPLPPTGTTPPPPSRRQVRHPLPPPADRYDTPPPPPADRYDTPSPSRRQVRGAGGRGRALAVGRLGRLRLPPPLRH